MYASHRPFGEIRGQSSQKSPGGEAPAGESKGRGLRSPLGSRMEIPGPALRKRTLPSGDQDIGKIQSPLVLNLSAGPLPSAGCQKSFRPPSRSDENTIRRPSGAQTGPVLFQRDVSGASVPRSRS